MQARSDTFGPFELCSIVLTILHTLDTVTVLRADADEPLGSTFLAGSKLSRLVTF